MTNKDRSRAKAQEAADLGWDALESRERTQYALAVAAKHFRDALAIDPRFADALNGLGNVYEWNGSYAEAEAMYRAALKNARDYLRDDKIKAHRWWNSLETRPYLRARHNLALVLRRQRRFAEAISECKEVLRRNPHDNTGVRYLLGGLLHLSGRVREAISCYRQAGAMGWFGGLDPYNEFNHALALFQTHDFDASILRFRIAFFLNMYLPLVVLGRRLRRLDVWHGSNLAEPEYTADYWEHYSDLWTRRSNARRFLSLVYDDEAVQADLEQKVALARELICEKDAWARQSLVSGGIALQRDARLKETNPVIVSRVLSGYRRARDSAYKYTRIRGQRKPDDEETELK